MSGVVCEVEPGPGSVARHGDSLVWASDQVPDTVWDTLLSCLALGDRPQGAGPLLHGIGETMRGDLGPDAAFAILVTDGAAGFVLRHGRVEVTLDGQPLQVGAVVSVAVAGRTLVAGAPDALQALGGRPGSSRHDLRDGAVAGAAFRWSAPGTPPHSPPSSPPELPPHSPAESPPDSPPNPPPGPNRLEGPAVDVTDVHAEATSDPEQTEFHPPPDRDSPSSPAMHPSAGTLVFEDGATVTLDGDVVLGRRPERHELVEGGQARALVIHDPENVLSSAHAVIRIQGDEVLVTDLDSLNGTHVAAPEARDWTKLEPGAPYPMNDGYRMLLGWTVLTYRSGNA